MDLSEGLEAGRRSRRMIVEVTTDADHHSVVGGPMSSCRRVQHELSNPSAKHELPDQG